MTINEGINRIQVIQSWREAKFALDQWKNIEAERRAAASQAYFANPTKGTNRVELGGGYKLKLVFGYNYTLGNKDMIDPATNEKVPIAKQVEALEDAIDALGNEGPFLRERLIRWKPELVESEYLKLNPEFPIEKEVKELIDAILTIKPASPQLTFEEPK